MAAGIVVMILGSIAWMVFQWGECRDAGMGVWYCIQHIA